MTNSRDLSTMLLLLKLLQRKRKRPCTPEPCCCCPCSCSCPEPPSPGPIPPPTPQPTYIEIAIPVPQPEGVTNLPANIYFQIDTRFTAAQQQQIRSAISGLLFHWFTHLTEKWNGGTNNGTSQLAACTNTYATHNLQPVWYQGPPISNGLEATNLAMDQFTQLIRDNGFRLSSPARIDYQIPSPVTSSTIRGETAFRQTRVPLSFIINPIQLDRVDINDIQLVGSMFHAWLHRAGFFDPKTSSYFIAEAPMCLMRGFQPKTPVPPDSFYIQFFD
ncbi:hypothetical protein [Priestia megaterium]|uniref:hypothetical protein n=1 Tax=Priestia megaterium TaxID=1404 RepID=UPI0020796976|nr:hypothetical protein [Priestia megaterium]USL45888.1 hypothetical protein LIS78_31120 [Priestia megaterium]